MAQKIKWGTIALHLLLGNTILAFIFSFHEIIAYILFSLITAAIHLVAFALIKPKTAWYWLCLLATIAVGASIFISGGATLLVDKILNDADPVGFLLAVRSFFSFGILTTMFTALVWIWFIPVNFLLFLRYQLELKQTVAP